MKAIVAFSFSLPICLGLLFCIGTQSVAVRPLEIRVVDSEDGTAIPGIPVYYQLIGARNRNTLGIPIDPVQFKYGVVRAVYETDKNGCLAIPSRKINLRRYEVPFEEWIYINVELAHAPQSRTAREKAQAFFTEWQQPLRNWNEKYDAAFLGLSWGPCEDSGATQSTTRGVRFKNILGSYSLQKTADSVVVPLDRKTRVEGLAP